MADEAVMAFKEEQMDLVLEGALDWSLSVGSVHNPKGLQVGVLI